jgi:hypothetical protein
MAGLDCKPLLIGVTIVVSYIQVWVGLEGIVTAAFSGC